MPGFNVESGFFQEHEPAPRALDPFTVVVGGFFYACTEIARKIEEAMAGRVGTNQHSERVGNTLATHEKGKSADIAAASVGKGLKIENGRFLIFTKSKTGKELAKVT